MSARIISFISVFLLVLIILSAIVYISVFKPLDVTLPYDSTPPITPDKPVDIFYRCLANSDCKTGVCDQNLGVCVKPNGSECNSSTECLSSSYCSGVCVSRSDPPNYLADIKLAGQYCPCSAGFECVNYRCYKTAGSRCNDNNECVSGLCSQSDTFNYKVCSNTKDIGYTCSDNNQCSSKNCVGYTADTKVCQPPGYVPGENGSYCGIPKDDDSFVITCNDGLSCTLSNECTTNVGGFNDGCSEKLACSNRYSCYEIPPSNTDDLIKSCDSGSDYCTCLFNYDLTTQIPQPNVIPITGVCTRSFDRVVYSDDNIRCIANRDVFCTSGSDCVSGSCTDSPKIYRVDVELPSASVELDNTTQRTYPITGLTGMIDIMYDSLSNVVTQRLFGYTRGYSVLNKSSSEYDQIYSLYEGNIYSLSIQSYLDLTIFNSGLILEQVLDADATTVNGDYLILTACLVSTTNGSRFIEIFSMTEYGTLSRYDTLQLAPPDLTTSTIRLSVVASKLNGIISPQYLLSIRTNTTTNLYFNGVSIPNPFGSNTPRWDTVTLNHGLYYSTQTTPISYRLIAYVNQSGLLTFTGPIDGTSVPHNYTGLRYPQGDYSVSSFAMCNVDPLIVGYSNVILSANPPNRPNILFYISDGVEYSLPGYPSSNASFLMTSGELYVYSPRSCS